MINLQRSISALVLLFFQIVSLARRRETGHSKDANTLLYTEQQATLPAPRPSHGAHGTRESLCVSTKHLLHAVS